MQTVSSSTGFHRGHTMRRAISASAALVATGASAQQEAAVEPSVGDSHQVEVYISEDALQMLYLRDAALLEGRDATLQGGVFLTENRDIVGIASAMTEVADQTRYPRWTFEVGARGYGALLSEQDQDVFGMGLGGQARFAFTNDDDIAAAFGAYYAPDILTFGDADGVYDSFVRLEFTLRTGLTAFVGYRLLEFDTDVTNRELDDHAHVGVRWIF